MKIIITVIIIIQSLINYAYSQQSNNITIIPYQSNNGCLSSNPQPYGIGYSLPYNYCVMMNGYGITIQPSVKKGRKYVSFSTNCTFNNEIISQVLYKFNTCVNFTKPYSDDSSNVIFKINGNIPKDSISFNYYYNPSQEGTCSGNTYSIYSTNGYQYNGHTYSCSNGEPYELSCSTSNNCNWIPIYNQCYNSNNNNNNNTTNNNIPYQVTCI